jgi:DNA-binding beta-propeller fold protein YncE
MSPRTLLLVSLVVLVPAPTRAAHIVLVAGGGSSPTGVPATEAKLTQPFGIDFDRSGNGFLVELSGNRVLKIDARGRLTTIAGTGKKGSGGDGGPAANADFNGPHNLAVAPNGDVFVADTWNNRVRKIDGKTGVITTFAGTGDKGFAGDGGRADKAQFGGIYCITFSPDGRKLHLADLDNRRIRAIDMATNVVTTVAGNGQKGVPDDGARAIDAPLVDPRAVASDANGNVYVLERSGHALRVVSPDGRIRTVVGTGKKGLSGDGRPGKQATLAGPKHLCVDRSGDVIIADSDNHCVRKYSPKTGTIVRVAGTGKVGNGGIGGPPEQVEFNQPHGVTLHVDGTLYICDSMNNRVLKIVP